MDMHEDREKHMANFSLGHIVAVDKCDFNPSLTPTWKQSTREVSLP